MKVGVIKSSELGSACWSAAKVINHCVGCSKYNDCTLPDRRRDPTYDKLREDSAARRREWNAAVERVRRYEAGARIDTAT